MEYALRDPILFGDFRNTLEESEPRFYEDIQDFEACKAVFQEVITMHDTHGVGVGEESNELLLSSSPISGINTCGL